MTSATFVRLTYDDGSTAQAPAQPGELALDALISAEVPVAFNCRSGICQACRALGPEGTDILLCQTAVPETGLPASVDYTPDTIATASVTRRARLASWNPVADDVLQIDMQLEFPIAFAPGQYATLLVPSRDGGRRLPRYFSCAGDPRETDRVRFFIRDFEDGYVSQFLRSADAQTPLCKIIGPHGTFILRDTPAPKLFVAGGTGLSPFLSMLHVMRADPASAAETTLIYGSSSTASVFGLDEIESAASVVPNFSALLCTDDGLLPGGQQGSPISFMDEALARLEESGAPAEIYLCGPPGLVEAAKAAATRSAGRRVFAESFAHT